MGSDSAAQIPSRVTLRLRVVRAIQTELEHSGVVWVLTGSLALALQGVPIGPRDIDIQTDRDGAYEIERRFAAQVLRPVAFSAAERVQSHFGALLIDGVTVEIVGDAQKRLADGTWEASTKSRAAPTMDQDRRCDHSGSPDRV